MTQHEYAQELTKAQKQIQVLHQRLTLLEQSGKGNVPDTMLLNDSFMKRSFAVLGHNTVASLIIMIPFYALMFAIIFALGISI